MPNCFVFYAEEFLREWENFSRNVEPRFPFNRGFTGRWEFLVLLQNISPNDEFFSHPFKFAEYLSDPLKEKPPVTISLLESAILTKFIKYHIFDLTSQKCIMRLESDSPAKSPPGRDIRVVPNQTDPAWSIIKIPNPILKTFLEIDSVKTRWQH